MSDKKRDSILYFAVIIVCNLIDYFIFKLSVLNILVSALIIAMVFFRPPSIYARIGLSFLVALLIFLVIFVFN